MIPVIAGAVAAVLLLGGGAAAAVMMQRNPVDPPAYHEDVITAVAESENPSETDADWEMMSAEEKKEADIEFTLTMADTFISEGKPKSALALVEQKIGEYGEDPRLAEKRDECLALIAAAETTDSASETAPSVVVTKITVSSLPNKTTYEVGDAFDPTGIAILVSYSDESEKIVGGSDCDFSADLTKVGSRSVTVIHEGKTTTFEVTVKKKTVEVSSLSLSKTSLTLTVGDSDTLKATINPSNATDKSLIWKSDKTDVVSVDQNGKVTAKKAGTATVTVTSSNGKSASCKVTVKKSSKAQTTKPETTAPAIIEVKSVTVSPGTLMLKVGESKTLDVKIDPGNAADKQVTLSSSYPGIVSVNGFTITAKKAGTATITATSSNGKTATCKVTVSKPAETTAPTTQPAQTKAPETTAAPAPVQTAAPAPQPVQTAAPETTAAPVTAAPETTAQPATIPVTSLERNQIQKSDLYIGESFTYEVTVKPENATNNKVTWTISDQRILKKISSDYNSIKVQGISKGTATLTAASVNDPTKTVVYTITVTEEPVSGTTAPETTSKETPQESPGSVQEYIPIPQPEQIPSYEPINEFYGYTEAPETTTEIHEYTEAPVETRIPVVVATPVHSETTSAAEETTIPVSIATPVQSETTYTSEETDIPVSKGTPVQSETSEVVYSDEYVTVIYNPDTGLWETHFGSNYNP